MKPVLFFYFVLFCLTLGANAQMGWRPETSGTQRNLKSVFFVNPDTGWAVGSGDLILSTKDGGNTWVRFPVPFMSITSPDSSLYSVYFSDANHGWIVGYNYYKTTNGGLTWTDVEVEPAPAFSATFEDTSNGWRVGTGINSQTTNGGTGMSSFTNKTSSILDNNGVPTAPTTSYCVAYVDNLAGGSAISPMIVGTGGVITQYGGGVWDKQTSNTTNDLSSISFVGTKGWISGKNGTVITTDNCCDQGVWEKVPSGTTANLNSLKFMSDGQNGLAVGDSGIILKSTDAGEDWIKQASGTSQNLTSVAYLSANTEWAVGNNGTILKYVIIVPSVPSQVSPAQNAANIPVSTTLTWTDSTGAVSYHIQLSADPSFATNFLEDSAITTASRAVGPLAYNTKYYWRVSAKSTAGSSAYSPTQYFTTATSAAVAPNVLDHPSLIYQANNSVRFVLPQKTYVVIQLFNTQGRLISKLMDKIQDAGSYNIPLPANLNDAQYLLNFRAGSFHRILQIHP
jgi:photosystem II stability/assembly factor-like uncharacterized protein